MVNAVNHNGWVVEQFIAGAGWVVFFGPKPERNLIEQYCEGLQAIMPEYEFRVYEALK